ncbi:hypothetical protein Sango_2720800 [Sesamum angolense]|uniref:Retrotransposon gag domain-containing protein n=1 Tax=Sesamum angolense TaxID=2727404 RepID=A0AAE2BHV1_9LAMI|nr:hypothetical protein Sango_2720800 [Sesamum angolense]
MQGDALSWFKWIFTNRQLSSWDAFTRSLELRFGPSSFDNHEAMLFKLRQHGSVKEFRVEFERLCNRVVGLPPKSILNCFIFGLRPDIQRELAVLRPSSISKAVGLAKLIEAKSADARCSSTPASPPASPSLPPLLLAPPQNPFFLPIALLHQKCRPAVLRAFVLIVTTSSPPVTNVRLSTSSSSYLAIPTPTPCRPHYLILGPLRRLPNPRRSSL